MQRYRQSSRVADTAYVLASASVCFAAFVLISFGFVLSLNYSDVHLLRPVQVVNLLCKMQSFS